MSRLSPTSPTSPTSVPEQRPPGSPLSALGAVLARPGEPAYDLARPWNVAVRVAPAGVVVVRSSDDVAAAVRAAREAGLRVAVQRTGHGAVAVGDDVLLVHTGGLDALSVDPVRRVARVGAGRLWQDVLDAAAPHGLTALCGSAPGVGVAGLLSGGGTGPFCRAYGLCSDRVRSMTVVTGDGVLRQVSATEHPELLWALRGGKGALGIVTELELELVPITTFYGGALWFDGGDAERVLRAWRRWCADLPALATTSVALLSPPGAPPLVTVRLTWPADPVDGERLLAPLRAAAPVLRDDVRVRAAADVGAVHADPVEPLPVRETAALLRELPEAAVDAVLSAAGPGSGCPQLLVELRQLGGALAAAGAPDCAYSHRGAAASLLAVGLAAPPQDAVVAAHGAQLVEAVRPWSTGGVPPNHDAAAPARQRWDTRTLALLRGLSEEYDPDGVLDAARPVREREDHPGRDRLDTARP